MKNLFFKKRKRKNIIDFHINSIDQIKIELFDIEINAIP